MKKSDIKPQTQDLDEIAEIFRFDDVSIFTFSLYFIWIIRK